MVDTLATVKGTLAVIIIARHLATEGESKICLQMDQLHSMINFLHLLKLPPTETQLFVQDQCR